MIQEKLGIIQEKLDAPKGQYNSFGKYKYRSCEDILQAVKPLLKETKTTLTISDKLVLIGERYYVEATVTLYDREDNSSISNTAYAREEESKKGMDGSQVTGASSSYARKYALNGLFCIDDNKDSDYTNTEEKKPTNATKKASEKQIELIKSLYDEENIAKMLGFYKISNLNELSMADASKVIERKKGE